MADKHFPIAVYGTLRSMPRDQGNASLMFSKKPIKHQKCFIPHFVPSGIWLDFKKNSSGIAEIFFYDCQDWPQILATIDKLEGFNYNGSNKYGYKRTLMNVRMLPDDYGDDFYEKGIKINDRDFGIPREDWNFPCVAAWVYSNEKANNLCKNSLNKFENPIISD